MASGRAGGAGRLGRSLNATVPAEVLGDLPLALEGRRFYLEE
jgi:hypothetical protein